MGKFQEIRKRALERVVAGLNRADEIGGEVRHFITDRVLVDERYIAARKRIAALRGTTYTSRVEAAAAEAEQAKQTAAAAPPPQASVPAMEKSLGDGTLPAQIYGRNSCPWTGRAIRLFEDLKVDYDYVDMDELDDAEREPLTTELVAATHQNTVPYVFLRGEFVGGFNALSEIQRAGKLDYLLMPPDERKNANPALANVVITPRPNSDEVSPGEMG